MFCIQVYVEHTSHHHLSHSYQFTKLGLYKFSCIQQVVCERRSSGEAAADMLLLPGSTIPLAVTVISVPSRVPTARTDNSILGYPPYKDYSLEVTPRPLASYWRVFLVVWGWAFFRCGIRKYVQPCMTPGWLGKTGVHAKEKQRYSTLYCATFSGYAKCA